MNAPSHLAGMRFGRLVGIERIASAGGHALWRWRCDCGHHKDILATSVKSGKTSSCGCVQSETRTKHGGHRTRTYRAWQNMKARAAGNGSRNKKYYADRGIAVCAQWGHFNVFLADMGECPEGMTLERQDNDLGYSPDNCQWATRAQQMRNTRRTHSVVYAGESMCLKDACNRAGVLYRTALRRMASGLSPQEAILR